MMRRVAAAWRRIPVKGRAQAARFLRLFVWAVAPAAVAGWKTHHLTLAVLLSLIPPALETAFRQLFAPPDGAVPVVKLPADWVAALVREIVSALTTPQAKPGAQTTNPPAPPS